MEEDKPIPKYLTDAYWESHPFVVRRMKMSPKNLENNFVQFVMNRAEYIRKRKGIDHRDVLPFDERFYRLLRANRRGVYAMTIFLLAEGLGVSIDELVEGYNDE